MPREIDQSIKKVVSDDGKSWLEHTGFDSSRDGGGPLFKFSITIPKDSKLLEGVVLVKNVTVFRAIDYAKKNKIDYRAMTIAEESEFIQKYSHEIGCAFRVHWLEKLEFDINALSKPDTIAFGRALCSLYLKRCSNHAQNNTDPDADPGGYYPDTIRFSPMLLEGGLVKHINKECFFEMTADEVFGQ